MFIAVYTPLRDKGEGYSDFLSAFSTEYGTEHKMFTDTINFKRFLKTDARSGDCLRVYVQAEEGVSLPDFDLNEAIRGKIFVFPDLDTLKLLVRDKLEPCGIDYFSISKNAYPVAYGRAEEVLLGRDEIDAGFVDIDAPLENSNGSTPDELNWSPSYESHPVATADVAYAETTTNFAEDAEYVEADIEVEDAEIESEDAEDEVSSSGGMDSAVGILDLDLTEFEADLCKDASAYSLQLEGKDKQLAQKNIQLQQLEADRQELLDFHNEQISNIVAENKKMADNANSLIVELQSKYNKLVSDADNNALVGLNPYLKAPRGKQKALNVLAPEDSNMVILTGTSFESMTAICSSIVEWIKAGEDICVVDLSCTGILPILLSLKGVDCDLSRAFDDDYTLSQNVTSVKQAKIKTSARMHSLWLLQGTKERWELFLSEVHNLANGSPVILLFDDVGDFCSSYAVGGLCNNIATKVVVKSTPIGMLTAGDKLAFLPSTNIAVTLLDFFPKLAGLEQRVFSAYPVTEYTTSALLMSDILLGSRG